MKNLGVTITNQGVISPPPPPPPPPVASGIKNVQNVGWPISFFSLFYMTPLNPKAIGNLFFWTWRGTVWLFPTPFVSRWLFQVPGIQASFVQWKVQKMGQTISESPERNYDPPKNPLQRGSKAGGVMILLIAGILHHLGCIKTLSLMRIHYLSTGEGFLPSTLLPTPTMHFAEIPQKYLCNICIKSDPLKRDNETLEVQVDYFLNIILTKTAS